MKKLAIFSLLIIISHTLNSEDNIDLLNKIYPIVESRTDFTLSSSVNGVIISNFFFKNQKFTPYEEERILTFNDFGLIERDYYRYLNSDGSYNTDGVNYIFDGNRVIQQDYYNYNSELEESIYFKYEFSNDIIAVTNSDRPGHFNIYKNYFENGLLIKTEIISSSNNKVRKTFYFNEEREITRTTDKNNQISEYSNSRLVTFIDFEGIKSIYQYGTHGYLEKIFEIQSDSTKIQTYLYEYIIDDFGNWVEQLISMKNNSGEWEYISKETRIIDYK